MILEEAFGETRSSARLKKLLYETVQIETESDREFTRNLLEIADKLKEYDKTKDSMLREVLCENVCEKSVHRELKNMILEKPNITFTDLRSVAIKLIDSEIETSKTKDEKSTARAHEVGAEANIFLSDVRAFDPWRQLTTTMEKMMEQQSKLIEMVTATQASQEVFTCRRLPLSEMECYRCHQLGHIAHNCAEPATGSGIQGRGRRQSRACGRG